MGRRNIESRKKIKMGQEKKCSGGNHGHQSSLVYETAVILLLGFLGRLCGLFGLSGFRDLLLWCRFLGSHFWPPFVDMNWIKELRDKYNILYRVCQEKNTKYSIFLSRTIQYVVLRNCCFLSKRFPKIVLTQSHFIIILKQILTILKLKVINHL